MTLSDPHDPACVKAWVLQLLSEHPKEEVSRRIWTAIREAGAEVPIPLGRALVSVEGPERLRAETESGRLCGPPDPHPVATAILRGEPVSDEQAAVMLAPTVDELELAAAWWDATAYVAFGAAPGHGIDLAPLFRSPALTMAPWVRERVDAANPAPEDRQRARSAERMTAYQSSVLRCGRMLVDDPRTGDRASYLGYLRRGGLFAYRFGREGARSADFYLLASGSAGELRCLYLPDRDALVDLVDVEPDDTSRRPIRPQWPSVKMQLAHALLEHPGPPRTGAPAGRQVMPQITVRTGGAQNFAHVLWNYYGGLAREQLCDNLGRAQRVVAIGSEFFGPPTEIYPEIGGESLSHRARGGRSSRHIASPGRLEFSLGSTLLWPEALERVAARARSLRDDPAVAPILERMAPHRVRLYVSLRVRDKSWADAGQQLPLLIDELVSRHRDACVLIDGFSVPSGVDHVTARWERQLGELRDLVDTIQARVAEPERVIDLMGLDLLRSIAILTKATVYLCPAGTAHHKVDFFCDIPGVLYISEQMRDHYEPLPGHRQGFPGHLQRVSSHQPRIVVGSDLDSKHVRHQRLEDRRSGLANFALPWERVWTELGPLLEQPGALRTAARTARRATLRIVSSSPRS